MFVMFTAFHHVSLVWRENSKAAHIQKHRIFEHIFLATFRLICRLAGMRAQKLHLPTTAIRFGQVLTCT
jgi:hypothetical protein